MSTKMYQKYSLRGKSTGDYPLASVSEVSRGLWLDFKGQCSVLGCLSPGEGEGGSFVVDNNIVKM